MFNPLDCVPHVNIIIHVSDNTGGKQQGQSVPGNPASWEACKFEGSQEPFSEILSQKIKKRAQAGAQCKGLGLKPHYHNKQTQTQTQKTTTITT